MISYRFAPISSQKGVLFFETPGSYDSSASALIKRLNWPTVADMIKVETACMV